MGRGNASFNHIAISVPDCEAAVKWYTKIFGFELIQPIMNNDPVDPGINVSKCFFPVLSSKKEVAFILIHMIVYGPELKAMKLALMTMGNDVAFEIFEFRDPKYNGPQGLTPWNPETYTRGGVFHICLTVPDVKERVTEILAAGGKLVGEVTELPVGVKTAYTQDPWGNVVELLDTTFSQLFLRFGQQQSR
jgi:catechol 2,3-dioxygenase-like lactoylglutathione lyase family enzyme